MTISRRSQSVSNPVPLAPFLQPGKKLALIGANGCGKSSLFAILLGVLPHDPGDVRGLSKMRIAHMA
ncbi:MAG: ATP-binding cassette domain-containing protein [Halieaceae bacterium]|jgi:ATP-binding cassette subfamily F protein 3|nr:ATP-binding cassette domain-containing protein [Halieaceae bacterium]